MSHCSATTTWAKKVPPSRQHFTYSPQGENLLKILLYKRELADFFQLDFWETWLMRISVVNAACWWFPNLNPWEKRDSGLESNPFCYSYHCICIKPDQLDTTLKCFRQVKIRFDPLGHIFYSKHSIKQQSKSLSVQSCCCRFSDLF